MRPIENDMVNIEEIQKQESEQAYQHLLAIRKILSHKAKRTGTDKAMADFLTVKKDHGRPQFLFSKALPAFNGPYFLENPEQFEQAAQVNGNVDMSRETSEKENRDIIRHIVALLNIRTTKCERCDAVMGCLGCTLSGDNFSMFAVLLNQLELADQQSIHSLFGTDNGANVNDINHLALLTKDVCGRGHPIKIANPEYETNY